MPRIRPAIVFVLASLFVLPPHSTPRQRLAGVEQVVEGRYANRFAASSPVPGLRGDLDEADLVEGFESGVTSRTSGVAWDTLRTDVDREAVTHPSVDQITWLGHATFLVQLEPGFSLLTDPVLGEYDGVPGLLALVRPELRRISAAPMPVHDMPELDAVVVSHNHYDHLDFDTLSNLPDYEHVSILVPLGVEASAPDRFPRVVGMGWYTSLHVTDDVTIHFVPAHHRSRRGLFDERKTLWGGWVIERGGTRIFFAGDTAFSPHFDEIRERMGPMDVCLMPIISYQHGRWHMSPEEALVAADRLDCSIFVPWGYGTFFLSPEHVYEPLRRLRAAAEVLKPDFEIQVSKQGETFALP